MDGEDEKRLDERGDQGIGHRLGDVGEKVPGAPGHDQHGEKGHDGGEGRAEDREHHLGGPVHHRRRPGLAHLEMAEDVFHDDHRVVHHDSGDQDEGEEGDGVEGHPGDPHDDHRAEKGEGNSDGGEEGVPEAEGAPEDHHDQAHAEDQVSAQGFHRVVDFEGGVVGEDHPDSFAPVGFDELPGKLFNPCRNIHGVAVGGLQDPEPEGVIAVDRRDRGRVPVTHPGGCDQIPDPDKVPVAVPPDDDIEDLGLARKPLSGVEHVFPGGLPEPAGGDLGVGRGNGPAHLVEGDAVMAEPGRVHRDVKLAVVLAADIDIFDPGDVEQVDLELLGHELQALLGEVAHQVDHHNREPLVGVEVEEDRLVGPLRKLVPDVEGPEPELVVDVRIVGIVDELDLDG